MADKREMLNQIDSAAAGIQESARAEHTEVLAKMDEFGQSIAGLTEQIRVLKADDVDTAQLEEVLSSLTQTKSDVENIFVAAPTEQEPPQPVIDTVPADAVPADAVPADAAPSDSVGY